MALSLKNTIFENNINIWSEGNLQASIAFITSSFGYYKYALSPDEQLLALSGDSIPLVWFIDIKNQKEVYIYDLGISDCEHIEFSPNGSILAMVNCEEKVEFFGIEKDEN